MGTDKNILDTIKENQLKAKIKELDNSINSYNGKISQCNQQIARAEQSYNSLLGFKNSVQSYCGKKIQFRHGKNSKWSRIQNSNGSLFVLD